LLARRLQVGEEPELLEHVRAHVLGLVDEERDVAACLRVLEQELVEALEEDELATAFRWHAELEQGVLEDLVEADRGVQEQDRLGRGPDRVEQAAQQRRLPGAGVADQRDEALARLDPVAEGGERLLVAVVEIEEAWIGGDVEGWFAEPEVLGVHGGKPPRCKPYASEGERPRRNGARASVHACTIMQRGGRARYRTGRRSGRERGPPQARLCAGPRPHAEIRPL